MPTRAYARALATLERHRFAVLSGPPELGKTAIARMLGLALLTERWELHECVRPDELWARFARDRPQVFIAEDAFGATEYRPEAAERRALELDRVLRAPLILFQHVLAARLGNGEGSFRPLLR